MLGIIVSLLGCKNNETALENNVINSAYDNCYNNLENLVKSPSSLNIIKANLEINFPQDNIVYKYFKDNLINKDTGKISILALDSQTRFRQLNLSLDYEAQNSFGASLRDKFSCSYIYKLREKNTSPDEIFLIQIETKDEVSKLFLPLKLNGSNIRMNAKFTTPMIYIGPEFLERDKSLFNNVEFYYSESSKE